MWKPPRSFWRYLALELPGWALAGVVLYGLVQWGHLTAKVALALGGLWVAKDFALYPWLRAAYEDGDPDATASLLGRVGRAREELDPRGYVVLGSELWRAERVPGSPAVVAGDAVRVLEVRGLTLRVERDAP